MQIRFHVTVAVITVLGRVAGMKAAGLACRKTPLRLFQLVWELWLNSPGRGHRGLKLELLDPAV